MIWWSLWANQIKLMRYTHSIDKRWRRGHYNQHLPCFDFQQKVKTARNTLLDSKSWAWLLMNKASERNPVGGYIFLLGYIYNPGSWLCMSPFSLDGWLVGLTNTNTRFVPRQTWWHYYTYWAETWWALARTIHYLFFAGNPENIILHRGWRFASVFHLALYPKLKCLT